MADLSMPLHTKHADRQAVYSAPGVIFEQPHFAYENQYVGANWTTGHNFSRFAKNVHSGYLIQNPSAQSKTLANYSNFYGDDAWDCGHNLSKPFNGNYTPPSSLVSATAFSLDEGQRYLIGLMSYGYQQMNSVTNSQGFTNQQDITLQLEQSGSRVQKVDLKNLRVSMGAGDIAYLNLNGRQILKFVDSSAGGNLYIYNENGNQLGVISKINGKPSYENMTFDISFSHDGSNMDIIVQKYYRGVLNSTNSYSYSTNNDMSTLRAYMTGYQSNVDYISSQYTIYYGPLSGTNTNGFFENQQDITLPVAMSGYHVQELDLNNLRVSMGAGDIAYININGRQILKFVDSSAGGNLYIYNENGNQLGVISKVNGKPSFENMTFDVSFSQNGSNMDVAVKKYYRGVLNSTSNYSYATNNDISTMRAYMTGYQSNVDYISSQYVVFYAP
ncbi:hypothetical protein MmiAt1_09620 [Methanimicrococcus sp. At1]|uniref:Uncharacterized protein n=1 Tax=Methanimicrococcus hacksteinii TaxID=3028293 RepID=A0ABU3VPZ6_9EURY|nr:hypothetical protein [Methanimicrococcus sp. At1]MDV0445385.1 hypothetical protein [Methanimicrococcus sp. At1]